MVDVLARNWWAVALRGIAAILFGLFAFFYPGVTLFALVIVFGAYALVDGVFALVSAVRAAESHQRWGQLLLVGICGILAAAVVWFYPGLAALSLLFVIAAWAIVTGVLEVAASFQLRQYMKDWWWWLIAGLASIVFGVLLFWRPGAGALAVLWIIGTYAIAFGIFLLGLAWRLHEHASGKRAVPVT
jgi:uncharacterized membrane protein HdeD (DUF308 family)